MFLPHTDPRSAPKSPQRHCSTPHSPAKGTPTIIRLRVRLPTPHSWCAVERCMNALLTAALVVTLTGSVRPHPRIAPQSSSDALLSPPAILHGRGRSPVTAPQSRDISAMNLAPSITGSACCCFGSDSTPGPRLVFPDRCQQPFPCGVALPCQLRCRASPSFTQERGHCPYSRTCPPFLQPYSHPARSFAE